jgi:GIY-YIG catalytic domain-containing protein/NUMOD1 domain-containing protein
MKSQKLKFRGMSCSFQSRTYTSFRRPLDIKPIVKYDNADIDKVKIFADNRNKLGVYRWINNKNGNTYVGSSVNLSVRFYSYFSLGSLAKSNRPIDRALLKYGFSNFSSREGQEILEYCDEKGILLEREQCYLDNLKPEYNIVEKAGSTLGYKHTEESLEKMRNFVLSEEVLAKKRLATENATASRRIPIIVEDLETNEKSEYISLSEVGKALGVSKVAISQALLANRLVKKRYVVKRKPLP